MKQLVVIAWWCSIIPQLCIKWEAGTKGILINAGMQRGMQQSQGPLFISEVFFLSILLLDKPLIFPHKYTSCANVWTATIHNSYQVQFKGTCSCSLKEGFAPKKVFFLPPLQNVPDVVSKARHLLFDTRAWSEVRTPDPVRKKQHRKKTSPSIQCTFISGRACCMLFHFDQWRGSTYMCLRAKNVNCCKLCYPPIRDITCSWKIIALDKLGNFASITISIIVVLFAINGFCAFMHIVKRCYDLAFQFCNWLVNWRARV